MISLEETFGDTFPFAPHVFDGQGARQHYVDEGIGSPVLLLHGEPSWGYLYREIIPILARSHRVIVPDLIGFGKSETPASFNYSGQGQADALEALMLALNLQDLTLVLHDWGGPIGGAVALRHPNRVRRLVMLNSVLPMGLPEEAIYLSRNSKDSPYFQWMSKLYQADAMDAVLGELGTIVPAVMKALQGVVRNVDDVWMRAYGSPFANAEECRGAIALPKSIVSGTNRSETAHPEAIEEIRSKPAMMIYGMKDRALLPENFIPLFRAGFRNAPVYELANAGHFVQEDAPETVAQLILQFARQS